MLVAAIMAPLVGVSRANQLASNSRPGSAIIAIFAGLTVGYLIAVAGVRITSQAKRKKALFALIAGIQIRLVFVLALTVGLVTCLFWLLRSSDFPSPN